MACLGDSRSGDHGLGLECAWYAISIASDDHGNARWHLASRSPGDVPHASTSPFGSVANDRQYKALQFKNPGKHSRMRRRDRANLNETNSFAEDARSYKPSNSFRGIEMKIKLALSALAAALVLGACGGGGGDAADQPAADTTGQATDEAATDAGAAVDQASEMPAEAPAEAPAETPPAP